MSLITIFFSLQSIIFLVGINFSSKKITQYLKLDKKLILLVFSILILLISFFFYILNTSNFIFTRRFSEIIYFFFVLLGYFAVVTKFTYFIKRKKKIKKLNFINLFYFILIINIFFSSVIPVTDADSIRYHLGQFNDFQKFTEYDLHSKISYIGDGLNVISYYSNSYNIVSCLNFYVIFLVISLIKKNLPYEKKILFSLFFLSIPIYLNLLVSQKPFLWLIFNLFYIFFLINKKYIKKNSRSFFIVLLNLSLIQVSKPEFLLIVPLFIVFLIISTNLKFNFHFKRDSKNFLYFAFTTIGLPLIFFLFNYLTFSDPTKILLIQNNIVEEKFINFLQRSNVNLSTSNIFEFFLSLGFPLKYFDFFSISLGLGFFICIAFSNFKLNKDYLFVISLVILNVVFLRINIEQHHSRNYILIFVILIYLFLQQKLIFKFFIKSLLIIQLIITSMSFLYFNYEIYYKKNYKNIAYNLLNEDLISEQVSKKKHVIIISDIDGNLFKKYAFVNIDYYNFEKNYFYKNLSKKIESNSKIKKVILIFRPEEIKSEYKKYFVKNLVLPNQTRNPFKKNSQITYGIYEIPKENF